MTKLLTGTRNFASGLFTTILFLFFLLVSGDTFLRRLVEILPSFSDKRQAVDISQQIESDISAYLVTITLRALSGARRSPASMPFEKSSTAVSVQAFSLLDDQVFDRKTYRAALPQLDYRERSLQCRVRGSDA